MALESSLANIVIRDNTIDQGRFSDGTTPVAYTYAYHAWIFGSSIIDGNTFIAPSASADMLNIDSCSCTITKNKFIRGSTSVNSYIRAYGSNDQIITNNTFDQTTINGSSDILVVGISSRTTYTSNKNQTIYVPFQITTSGSTSLTDFSQAFFYNGGFSPYGTFPAIPQEIYISGTDAIRVKMETNLGMMLPDGVKLLAIKFGLLRNGTGVVNTGANYNAFELNINIWDTVKANYITGTGSIMDIAGTSPLYNVYKTTTSTATQTILFNSGTAWADILAAEVYYELDLSANNYCVNNRDYLILAHMQYDMKFSSGDSSLFISPLVAKCIW